ncbi:MAG: ATP-grasp domain-containing protein [Myxococcota bacterium]
MSLPGGVQETGLGGVFLVVGGGPFQLGLIDAVRGLGFQALVVDQDAQAPGMNRADIAHAIDVCDVDRIAELGARYQVVGVQTAASDVALPAVAHAATRLDLPGLPLSAVDRCRDKLRAFDTLDASGVGAPRTWLARGVDEAVDRQGREGLEQLVLKPRRGAGGRGVSVCATRQEIERAFAKAERYVGVDDGGLLVQEFVDGTSIGFEGSFYRGELVGGFVLDDQLTPGFVSPVGHSVPSTLPSDLRARIHATANRVAEAFGLTDGPVNLDLRLRDGEIVVIEINPRLGGNSISELIRLAYGLDLCEAAALIAVGKKPELELAGVEPVGSAARLLVSSKRGTVRFRSPLPEFFQAFCEDGEPTSLHVDNQAILGRALCRGGSSTDAADRAREVCLAAKRAVEVV